jgi:hypothetical protein
MLTCACIRSVYTRIACRSTSPPSPSPRVGLFRARLSRALQACTHEAIELACKSTRINGQMERAHVHTSSRTRVYRAQCVLAAVATLLVLSTATATAVTYAPIASTSLCYSMLPPSYRANVTLISCAESVESALGSLPSLLSALSNPSMGLASGCALAAATFACVRAYPNPLLQKPCSSMYSSVVDTCGVPNPAASVALVLLAAVGVSSDTVGADGSCYAPSAAAATSPTSDVAFTPTLLPLPQCLASYTAAGGSVCASLVDYAVYVPAGSTFASLEAKAASLSFVYNLMVPSESREGCYRALTRQLCTNVFLACDDQPLPRAFVPAPLPFPRFACRADCADYTLQCAAYIPTLARVLSSSAAATAIFAPNCTGSGAKIPAGPTCGGILPATPPLEDFPDTKTYFALKPVLVATMCNALDPEPSSLYVSTNTTTLAVAVVSHCPLPLLPAAQQSDAIPGTTWSVIHNMHDCCALMHER